MPIIVPSILTGVRGPSKILPSPQGNKIRILLSSVFGPYAQDDAYGSQAINPMELYQNQVTSLQGGFSLRCFVHFNRTGESKKARKESKT
jgi:hypothetical protein